MTHLEGDKAFHPLISNHSDHLDESHHFHDEMVYWMVVLCDIGHAESLDPLKGIPANETAYCTESLTSLSFLGPFHDVNGSVKSILDLQN